MYVNPRCSLPYKALIYHLKGASLIQYLLGAIPFGNVVIAPAAAAIPSAQGVVDALKKTQAHVALLVPSVVAELAQNPLLLDYVTAHLELILYIGGDLPQAFGDLGTCAWLFKS